MALPPKILPPMPAVRVVETDGRAAMPMLDNDDQIKRKLFELELALQDAQARLTAGGL